MSLKPQEKGAEFNSIVSAGEMYRCWPSRDWLREGELPVKDRKLSGNAPLVEVKKPGSEANQVAVL